MYPLTRFLSLALAVASGTRALDASIFTFDPSSPWQNTKTPVITDDVARHLLELRMNVPTASVLGKWDQDILEVLDRYGGVPRPLFGSDIDYKDATRSLVILEGIEVGLGSSVQQEYQGDLVISSASANGLIDGFLDSSSGANSDSYVMTTRNYCKFGGGVEISSDVQTIENCIPKGSAFEAVAHVFGKELLGIVKLAETWVDEQSLTAVLKISLQFPDDYVGSGSVAESLTSTLHGLRALSSEAKQITAVLLPTSSQGKGPKSKVNPRGAVRQESAVRSTGAAVMTTLQRPTHPVCFTSNSSCNVATDSCSGHGVCHKKSGSANDEAASDCYACKCKSTIVTKEDGTVQKIQWGGSACQKRDISSPFFLIAGISILVVMAAGTAIGMLFHIGQNELPGVISAGVGPAKAQK
ncbi:hypothetical protein ANOM_010355 [Aspergillus nomiae NRRL 13137]|uniref:Vacuolar sorting protein Vps3844 C-terminal domain-containing protein n=1 Tax=Aspergillus nomiae NRRL (strain ATCC 15546 / NRRL 13137 / CBS 260.88 / M93) TaxID=1509407 RepID=A0A0L1ILZ4_ASPN3|nr:uncharacterized protein ANOM_010355 [Aspergillus nomiae NRRL 13137]KNG80631.1 hypothetical protein ANOM_010355 [Aspergillus nomiae NRRL 13137]